MTVYRKRTDGSTVDGEASLKALFPNTSFPKPLTDAVVASLGYDAITDGTTPTVSSIYESVVKDEIKEVSGKWTQTYKVVAMSDSEKTALNNDIASSERNQRNFLLAETDWMAGSDLTISDAWKTYRQALRDLPTASGWPHTHTWPTKPS